MKKMLILFVLVFAFLASADTTIVNTSGLDYVPVNTKTIYLYDGTSDLIEDSTYVTFGPYAMSGARNNNMYKGFQLFSDSLKGTSPQAAFAYQLSWSSDTSNLIPANWSTVDTLPEGGTTNYFSLDTMAAPYIYYRIHNFDATYDTMGAVILIMEKDE